jgi:hypothetical protein
MVIQVNLWGASYVMNEAISTFRDFNKPQGGVLLQMSSMLADVPVPAVGVSVLALV